MFTLIISTDTYNLDPWTQPDFAFGPFSTRAQAKKLEDRIRLIIGPQGDEIDYWIMELDLPVTNTDLEGVLGNLIEDNEDDEIEDDDEEFEFE